MPSRSSAELLCHELGHAIGAMTMGKDSAAIAREGRGYYAVWISGGFSLDTERAVFVAAGPLADLLRKGIIDENMAPNQIEYHLRTFLAADDDGTTDGDAARFARFYNPLPIEAKEMVILVATKAASKAVNLYTRLPQLFIQLADIIDSLPDDIVVVVTAQNITDLNSGKKVTLSKRFLSNFLNEGDRDDEEAEMRDEAFRILTEMLERGEITNGRVNQSGLARLDLNERR